MVDKNLNKTGFVYHYNQPNKPSSLFIQTAHCCAVTAVSITSAGTSTGTKLWYQED
jgi:hypothetical protein